MQNNSYCELVDEQDKTVKSLSDFLHYNPAYRTHSISLSKIFNATLLKIPKLMPKRALADISTDKFISAISPIK